MSTQTQAWLFSIGSWIVAGIFGLVLTMMISVYAEENFIIGTADPGWGIVQGVMGAACSFFPLSFGVASRAYQATLKNGSWRAAVWPTMRLLLMGSFISCLVVAFAIFGLSNPIPRGEIAPFVFPSPTP